MPEFLCCANSPIFIEDKDKFFFPYVQFKDKLYLINEDKFFDLLEYTGLLKEFLIYNRENGHKQTVSWLRQNGLLNEGFLENASAYFLDYYSEKRINNLNFFRKNTSFSPFLSEDFIKDCFKKSFIFLHLYKNRYKFNDYVKNEIYIAKKEVSYLKDPGKIKGKKSYYQKRFLYDLLINFLSDTESSLTRDFKEVDALNVRFIKNLEIENLEIYKVGNLDNYRKFKFETSDNGYCECLKKNSNFIIDIARQGSAFRHFEPDVLLDCLDLFAKERLEFEQNYIGEKLGIEISSECVKEHVSGVQKILNKCINEFSISKVACLTKERKSKHLILKNSSKSQISLLHKYFISNCYKEVINSNFLLCSDGDLIKNIILINTDKELIKSMEELFFGYEGGFCNEIINFALNSDNIPLHTMSYANLNMI